MKNGKIMVVFLWGVFSAACMRSQSIEPVAEMDSNSLLAGEPSSGKLGLDCKSGVPSDEDVLFYYDALSGTFAVNATGKEVQQVILFDLEGDVVYKSDSSDAARGSFGLAEMEEGVYVVCIVANEERFVKHLVVRN